MSEINAPLHCYGRIKKTAHRMNEGSVVQVSRSFHSSHRHYVVEFFFHLDFISPSPLLQLYLFLKKNCGKKKNVTCARPLSKHRLLPFAVGARLFIRPSSALRDRDLTHFRRATVTSVQATLGHHTRAFLRLIDPSSPRAVHQEVASRLLPTSAIYFFCKS